MADYKYIIPELAAARLSLNPVTLRKYLREGRVLGAERVQGKQRDIWIVPASITIRDVDIPLMGRPRARQGEDNFVRPVAPISRTVVELSIAGRIVRAYFPERKDAFGDVLKRLGYVWKDPWQREFHARAGDIRDRAAELGRHLLAAKFCVRFPSAEVRRRAVTGDYEPEHRRWVLAKVKGQYKNWFVLEWPRIDDFFDRAIRIGGAKYDKPHVVIPPDQFMEVQDFAQMHNFRLSDTAQRVMAQAQKQWDLALVVDIDSIELPAFTDDETPTELAAEDAEIDDDLADEPL